MERYDELKKRFGELADSERLLHERIDVIAVPLTPQEAIGNPEDDDYPILKGKERLMQAEFRGSYGQAFTDMFGNFSGSLDEILAMELNNNFRRAVFVASLNAVARHCGVAEKTIHCRNGDPPRCAQQLISQIREHYNPRRVTLVGMQPRMAEALSSMVALRITDMDPENIGTVRHGVRIDGPERTDEHLQWCDLAVITGTTVVNGSIEEFLTGKPALFYGVSVAATAALLGLERFCPFGS